MLNTHRGRLVSIEGLNGVGKSYLTDSVITATAKRGQRPPQVIEGFSRRTGSTTERGRRLLRILIDAGGGEYFLRGGFPRSETLLLLAIKMHHYEAALAALLAGDTVIEGRSSCAPRLSPNCTLTSTPTWPEFTSMYTSASLHSATTTGRCGQSILRASRLRSRCSARHSRWKSRG
jgi:hypothetical protein